MSEISGTTKEVKKIVREAIREGWILHNSKWGRHPILERDGVRIPFSWSPSQGGVTAMRVRIRKGKNI